MNWNEIEKPDNFRELAEKYMKDTTHDYTIKDICGDLYISNATFFKWLNEEFPNRKPKRRGSVALEKPANYNEVMNKYLTGELDWYECTKLLYVSYNTFYKWVNEDFPNRDRAKYSGRNKIKRPKEYEDVAERYFNNDIKSRIEAGYELGVSAYTFGRWLNEDFSDRLKPDGRRISRPVNYKEIAQKYINHETTMTDCAAELFISTSCLSNWLREDFPNRDLLGPHHKRKIKKPDNYDEIVEKYFSVPTFSQKMAGNKLGVSDATFRNWIRADYPNRKKRIK